MFDNIGAKLKIVAQVMAWLGIILSVVVGLISLVTNPLSGILMIILGCLCSWLSSLGMYGFGELIEKVTSIEHNISGKAPKSLTSSSTYSPVNKELQSVFEKWTSTPNVQKKCPYCGEIVSSNQCGMCGKVNNLFDK